MTDLPPIQIRESLASDWPAIVELGADVFAPFGAYREVLARWLATDGVTGFVAERDGEFCGAVLVVLVFTEHHRLAAEILAIEVATDHQRTGVGRALLTRLFTYLRSVARVRAVTEVRLSTAVDNLPAQQLFGTFGFAIIRENAGIYTGGQRILRMSSPIG